MLPRIYWLHSLCFSRVSQQGVQFSLSAHVSGPSTDVVSIPHTVTPHKEHLQLSNTECVCTLVHGQTCTCSGEYSTAQSGCQMMTISELLYFFVCLFFVTRKDFILVLTLF